MPAVILVEMIAQVGGLAAGAPEDPTTAPAPVRLRVAGLGPFRFKEAVRPGARLIIDARVLGRFGGLVQGRGARPCGRRAGGRRQRHARNRCTAGMRRCPDPERRRRQPVRCAGWCGPAHRSERPGPEAVAVGVGVFIGALPVYGLHLVLCLTVGSLLRLNRLKLYVAANISNPLMAPLLIMSEIQAGALARARRAAIDDAERRQRGRPLDFGGDLIVGSLIVGAVLGLTLGAATYLLTRHPEDDPFFADLVRRASERFVASSIVAWEFARGKLAGDPLYRAVVMDGVLPAGGDGTVVDVGCGSGLTLALLAEVAAAEREGRWPSDQARAPVLGRLVGDRTASARRAFGRRRAGGCRDDRHRRCAARSRRRMPMRYCCSTCSHMIPHRDQEQLIATVGQPAVA